MTPALPETRLAVHVAEHMVVLGIKRPEDDEPLPLATIARRLVDRDEALLEAMAALLGSFVSHMLLGGAPAVWHDNDGHVRFSPEVSMSMEDVVDQMVRWRQSRAPVCEVAGCPGNAKGCDVS